MKTRQAFVLAGGKGERLRPLTDGIPKPLVRVNGKPILQYGLELLAENGIEKIILGTGYLHEKIESFFGDGKRFGLDIQYSVESVPLGTGGALKLAEPLLEKRFCMMNGDTISDIAVAEMGEMHARTGAFATLAVRKIPSTEGFGVILMQGTRITKFDEKPSVFSEKEMVVNAGLYVLEKKALEWLPSGFGLIEKTLFPLLAEKKLLQGFFHKGLWLTTDTIERIRMAEDFLKRAPKA